MRKTTTVLLLSIASISLSLLALYIGLNSVLTEVTEIERRYSNLLLSYADLQRNYTDIIVRYNNLLEELRRTLSENEVLRSKVNELDRAYRELSDHHRRNITYYESRLTKLLDEVRKCREEEERLRSMLSRAVIPADLPYEDHTLNIEFLRRAIDSLSGFPEVLPDLTNMNLSESLINLIKWISTNFYYQNDLKALIDYWKLPNETLVEEGGDCEDYAVFTYALLKRAGFKHVYLISWNTRNSGHVGVLTFKDGLWYLVDPAWSLLNGYVLLMELNISSSNSVWTITIHPSHLSPAIKRALLDRGLTRYKWFDIGDKAYVVKPELNTYYNLSELLIKWLASEGYEADVWFLITGDETIITRDLSKIVNALEKEVGKRDLSSG